MDRTSESQPPRAAAGAACVTASVAIAPGASTASAPAEKLVKTSPKTQSQALGVMNPSATTHPLRCHLSLAQYGSTRGRK
jgi:hypothetical protein